MAEYIERKILKSEMTEAMCGTGYQQWAIDVIDRLPAADVVEVVRCKDCKDYRQNPYSPEEDMMCMCWCDWLPTDPDDFCSYGEKKEGAEE